MTARGVVRVALLLLTMAAFYNMFTVGGIRNAAAVSAVLGELPRCEPK